MLYILLDMCLYIYGHRILLGFKPTTFVLPFTLRSPDHYHIALFRTCIIVSLQWHLYFSSKSRIRIADVALIRFQHLCLNGISTTKVDYNLSQNSY